MANYVRSKYFSFSGKPPLFPVSHFFFRKFFLSIELRKKYIPFPIKIQIVYRFYINICINIENQSLEFYVSIINIKILEKLIIPNGIMDKTFLLLQFLFFFSVSAQTTKDDILGRWMSIDKRVAVHIYHEGSLFKAKVIWFEEQLGSGMTMNSRVDLNNPNPKLRNVKVIGMDILEGLNYNSKSQHWENGRIYDASSGRTWDASAEINESGQLCVRGYWKWKCLGRSLYFIRMKEKE